MLFKAARFRIAFVHLRALRGLRSACDSAAFSPRLRNWHRGRHWGRVQKRKLNAMTTETNNTRPTHRIFAVTKGDKKKFWQPIGALWAHSDGKGFNQKLDYLPLTDAEIVIRVISDDTQTAGAAG